MKFYVVPKKLLSPSSSSSSMLAIHIFLECDFHFEPDAFYSARGVLQTCKLAKRIFLQKYFPTVFFASMMRGRYKLVSID